MPESSQKTKKESHSAWVRKRNFRRMYKASKLSSSKPPVVTVDLSKNTNEIRSVAPSPKRKSWWAAMKGAFVDRGENRKNAV